MMNELALNLFYGQSSDGLTEFGNENPLEWKEAGLHVPVAILLLAGRGSKHEKDTRTPWDSRF